MNEARKRSWGLYLATVVVVAAATAGIMYLYGNINQRMREAEKHVFEVVKLTEETVDPVEWGKNFPRQYDSYIRTVDTERTRYGAARRSRSSTWTKNGGRSSRATPFRSTIARSAAMPTC